MEARKIIITGGATRIGAAIAKKLSGPNKEILIHFNNSKIKAEKLKKELSNNDWRQILNNNLEDMYKGGCWGVPTIKLSSVNDDYVYYQWGQDRIHFVEKEIISKLSINHQ